MSLYQTADNMARDLSTSKDAIKLLGNKTDSIVKAIGRGEPVTDTVIAKIMVENNVEELTEKVNDLISQGILKEEESVTENSFVVGQELDENGAIANPRMQFVVSSLQEPLREKLKGAKVGDTLDLQEGKWKFSVLATYSINTPPAPEAQVSAPEAQVSTSEAQVSTSEVKEASLA